MSTGAIGCGISGSGPSVFALCNGPAIATNVAASMQERLTRAGTESSAYVSSINRVAARLVNEG